MPDVMIRGGASFWAPDRDEMRGIVQAAVREEAAQRAAQTAKKRIEETIPLASPATTFFTGPLVNEGYIWSFKLAGVTLASAGTLQIYKASVSGDTRRPLFNGASGTPQVATWSADQARIRHGEGLYLVASQNITILYVAAWEVPAEKEALIYD